MEPNEQPLTSSRNDGNNLVSSSTVNKTKLPKISETQRSAIQYMKDNYELGNWSGYNASVTLQHGECGRGGKTANITFGTFRALLNKGLIEKKPNQDYLSRPTRYQLTELGKLVM